MTFTNMRLTTIWCLFVFTVLLQITAGAQETVKPGKFEDNCYIPHIVCDIESKYRTIDGTCNNLQNPQAGSYGEAMKRLLPNAYDDGRYIPRFRSVLGGDLPSAREISMKTITNVNESEPSPHTNLQHVFGQFLTHDIINSRKEVKRNGQSYDCCDETESECGMWDVDGGPCFPIKYPDDDPTAAESDCRNFIRLVGLMDCSSDARSPINFVTAYLDGSNIYGSSEKIGNSLRLFEKGKLRLGPDDLLPVNECKDRTCLPQKLGEYCFLAGDVRINVHPGLISVHTIFHRFHNQIADGLAQVNPTWNDERLYQEARRILGAVLQHIAYNDYIPLLIGPAAMTRYRLQSESYHRYNESMNPAVFSSFAGAGARFGHSSIPSQWTYGSDKLKVEEMIKRPFFIQADQGEGLDNIVKGMFADFSQRVDLKFSRSLHDRLFSTPTFPGNDLVAFSIQRGREIGLPSYNLFREACGLTKLTSLDAGTEQTDILKKGYQHVDDVDLYIGGLSESPVDGGFLGPTFACIIGEQFMNLKYSDRFWFENERPVEYDESSGFTQDQLNEIRNLKLSRIICDNSNVRTSPKNPFLQAGDENPEVDCTDFSTLPALNLNLWND